MSKGIFLVYFGPLSPSERSPKLVTTVSDKSMLGFSRANHYLEIPTVSQLLAIITMDHYVDGVIECKFKFAP